MYLLTGATGFVGGRVARALTADGMDVVALCRAGSEVGALACAVVRFDEAALADTLAAAVASGAPDVVVHLASVSRGREDAAQVAGMLQSNVAMPGVLLAAAMAAGVRRWVNTGTSWQTAGTPGTDASAGRYAPFNVYAATKQAFEDLLAAYVPDGLAAVTLRLFDTYGRGDPRGKVVDLLANAARSGAALAMSPGAQVLDLVHVEDVARAFVVATRRVLEAEPGHDVYGVTGTRLTLRELAALVDAALDLPVPVQWGGRPYRTREIMQPATLPALPGWSARVMLADGLREALT